MPDALINGLAGAGSGIVAQLLTYPLQTVNARQQTERDPSKPAFKDGAVRQLCLVVKNEGWGGSDFTAAPSLVGTAASQGVYYYFYQIFRSRAEAASLRRSIRGIGDGSVGMLQSLTVAALSGCVNVLLTNPIWIVVTRIQTDRKTNKQQNPQDQGLTSGLDKALQTAPVENIPHKIINVDILLRDQAKATAGTTKIQKEIIEQHISHRLRFSLRAYISILYLKKYANFQIILRGKLVEHISVAHDLKFKKVVTYKPQVMHDSQVVSVKVDIGFAKQAPVLGIFGMNVYHKNRLIMPFWKVLQEESSRGRSVVGVLEANFIEPAHDKQDFERTPLFIRLETKLRQIIIDYWKNNCHLIGYQPMNPQLKSQHKAGKDSGGPGHQFQQKSSIAQRTGAHSSNLLPETYDDSAVVGLTANGAGSGLPFSGHAQENSMNSAGLEEDLVNIGSDGALDPNFIEKLSEENISLYTRREELRLRDAQLRQTILELEYELEETKRKCSQISSELQVRKSQQQLPYM